MRPRWYGWCGALALALAGCGRPPPASQFPDAAAAIARMRDSASCSRGLVGEARLDYLGEGGRLRAKTLYLLSRPARVRFDVQNPLGGVLSVLTADGQRFALLDVAANAFLTGPASACSVRQALQVPIPPPALAELLTGLAPILRHSPDQASIVWEDGAYSLSIASTRQARQRVRLAPHPDDFGLPWQNQRVRVSEVEVWQVGQTLYRAKLEEHAPAGTAAARVDPDGLEPPIGPSGPACAAEVPRRLRFEVPSEGTDLLLEQLSVEHNPPLVGGVFSQQAPPGVQWVPSPCTEPVAHARVTGAPLRR